jgi:hypothetical protein
MKATMRANNISNLDLVPESRVDLASATWALARTDAGLRLAVSADAGSGVDLASMDGDTRPDGGGTLLVGPLSPRNAAALRRHQPWLAPEPVGLRTSAGLGDRLGLATPGHIRALREVGGGIVPVFAQQSVRELTRTGRTAQHVLDAATWGALEGGWRGAQGADADHLKTTADIDAYLEAGFTWFTVDPGEYVDSSADRAGGGPLRDAVAALPWAALEDTAASLAARYLGAPFDVEGYDIAFTEETLLRSAAKYGRAVAHVAAMYRHVAGRLPSGRFDFEVSVDETETPTTAAEHVYVARELARLGVRWTSLAPRFVGRFEKGVDYIGPIAAFEDDFRVHAAIARHVGPYKLSLHSGSDKFSIYEIAVRHTRGLVHLKTAGTSYVEALRTLARVAPALFREIGVFAVERYDTDRASYHVSAEAVRVPRLSDVPDAELDRLLDHFDARQVLHVTFGSVLTAAAEDGRPRFAHRIAEALGRHREAYAACLRAHFVRHLAPFARTS